MAVKLTNLVFDVKMSIGEQLLLVEPPRSYSSYKEGIKTGAEGMCFVCLSEKLGYDKVSIKVPGILQSPFEFKGTPIAVKFEGLEGKVWQDWNNKGEIKLSVTAKDVRAVTEKTKIKISTGGEQL